MIIAADKRISIASAAMLSCLSLLRPQVLFSSQVALQDDGLEEDASSPAQEASPAVSQAQYQQLREEADLVMLVSSACCRISSEALAAWANMLYHVLCPMAGCLGSSYLACSWNAS